MIAKIKNEFYPNYAIHPGEILEETIVTRGISKGEFAERSGLSLKTVSQIINLKQPITPDTALQIEKVLGVSADIWNRLDSQYRLFKAREENRKELEKYRKWATDFPLRELKNLNIITTTKDIPILTDELFSFFGVANIKAWDELYGNIAVAYRKSPAYESSPSSIAAWLRIAELEAENIETERFNINKFKKNLLVIRNMTDNDPEIFEPRMKQLCRESGVALVIVPELPKTRLYGATRWISRRKALIALTVRYKSEDQFWFSFFHEAGHLVLHGKDKDRVFIDHEKPRDDILEDEADKYAKDILIPTKEYIEFIKNGSFYKSDIIDFAKNTGIAAGIVVGFLQHDEYIQYSWHNSLKRRFEVEITN